MFLIRSYTRNMNLHKIQLSDRIYSNFTELFMQNISLKMLTVHKVMMILLAILWFSNIQRILCSKEIPLVLEGVPKCSCSGPRVRGHLKWPGGLWKFWSSSLPHHRGRALALWRLNRAWLGMSKFRYLNKKQGHFKLTMLCLFIYLLI